MKRLFFGLSFAAMALFVACGGETTNNITETTGMTLVEKGEKLPGCTDENAGQMVYATDSAAAFFCAAGEWQSLRGEKGDVGEQGVQGEQGPKGDAGESCTAKALKNGRGYKIVCGGDSVGVVLNGGESSASAPASSNGSVYDAAANTFTDQRDGKAYSTVTIAPTGTEYSEIWMAENLNYETSNSYCYGDAPANCTKYGRLYTWAAAVGRSEDECGYGHECGLPSGDVRGVCPEGWHLPSYDEWNALFTAVGGQSTAGKVLKSQSGWKACSGITNDDAFGFSALPAGFRYGDGDFVDDGNNAYFWSSTESTEYASGNAYYMYLYYYNDSGYLDGNDKYYGFSVRCLKD